MAYNQDNTIQFIFEKIFDKKTTKGRDLLTIPYNTIYQYTFGSDTIYQIIHTLTRRPLHTIQQYLQNSTFQQKTLFVNLKNKINVQILLGNYEEMIRLSEYGYQPNDVSLQLAIVNNRLDIIRYFSSLKLSNGLLMIAVEFGHDEIYFYLREHGLKPNVHVFYKSIIGNSFKIVSDINSEIGVSKKILEEAFKMDNSEIITLLINDDCQISPNLLSYPIMNANMELIQELEKRNLVTWHEELYYSAILSGSMTMIALLERHLPKIHDNFILDTTKSKKGYQSLLTDEMVYQKNGKKYFSHTMNYAIQSGTLDMIQYIYSKGYGITPSNIITAIKIGNLEIFSLVLSYYHTPLDIHIMHYFGMSSYVPNKYDLARKLLGSKLLNLSPTTMRAVDYKKETLHLNLIRDTPIYSFDNGYDIDYLMEYGIFFTPPKGHNMNHRLLTKIRLFLEMHYDLSDIMTATWSMTDKQAIIDSIYLFGDITCVKKYHFLERICPSPQIIMETLCYNQIGKFCYLTQNGFLTENIFLQIYPIIVMLSDSMLNQIVEKLSWHIPYNPKYILLSGKYDSITVIDQVKDLLMTENIVFISKFDLSGKLDGILEWAIASDLLEVANNLKLQYAL